jgi:3-hydroxyisobutyrate dehydrogenase/2-hydroxy-3-oxopropionate reductase
MTTSKPHLAFVGIGQMGLPMARNLLAAGYPLTVLNRSRANADRLAAEGARLVANLDEAAARGEVVMTALPTPDTVGEVFLGAGGLVALAAPGTLLIDFSTVSPDLSREIAAAARRRGLDFLDAPISGGPEGAAAATLTIMCGGDAAAFARARPIFESLGSSIHHVGSSGAGIVVKLVNQLLVAVNSAAVAEALVFGLKAGADPRAMFEIIRPSYGASRMWERNAPRIIDGDFTLGAAMTILLKDLGVIHDVAGQLGITLDLATTAREMYAMARDQGFGGRDFAALVIPLAQAAGVSAWDEGQGEPAGTHSPQR